MRVNEQWLMSSLIDQSNLAKALAKLSLHEVSLYKEDLRQVLNSTSDLWTQLEALLTSEQQMHQDGSAYAAMSGLDIILSTGNKELHIVK